MDSNAVINNTVSDMDYNAVKIKKRSLQVKD